MKLDHNWWPHSYVCGCGAAKINRLILKWENKVIQYNSTSNTNLSERILPNWIYLLNNHYYNLLCTMHRGCRDEIKQSLPPKKMQCYAPFWRPLLPTAVLGITDQRNMTHDDSHKRWSFSCIFYKQSKIKDHMDCFTLI